MQNQVLHIHYLNGPDGIRVVILGGWNGRAYFVPRSELKDLFGKENLRKAGLYFLIGKGKKDKDSLYIGESELLDGRINLHDKKKDFWDKAVIFCDGIDGAQARYLESQSLKQAKKANRYDLENLKGADSDTLKDYARVEADDYLDKCSFILSALGLPVFETVEKKVDTKDYFYSFENIKAQGFLTQDQGFMIKAGSTARINFSEACPPGVIATRFILQESGVLKEEGKSLVFTKDQYFSSVSTAAAVVRGTAANGWTVWKDKDGKTLDENVRK